MQSHSKNIFVTGGSGYIGKALIPLLLKNNYNIKCLVREKSINKLQDGCTKVIGNVLDKNSYKKRIPPSDTFIHLVGVPHPSPSKADLFIKIDLVSLQQSVEAALNSGIRHFIFISVAHPAPIMREYVKVREECERTIIQSGLNATILRPWYVLGPGHYWPYLLIPVYKLLVKIPSTAESAKRLGLVTINQMVQTLLCSIENAAKGIRIIDVPQIKKIGSKKNKKENYYEADLFINSNLNN